MGLLAAVALATSTTGCFVNDNPKTPYKAKQNSAKARCAGEECRVRIVCKGKVHVRIGPAPVDIRTARRPP